MVGRNTGEYGGTYVPQQMGMAGPSQGFRHSDFADREFTPFGEMCGISVLTCCSEMQNGEYSTFAASAGAEIQQQGHYLAGGGCEHLLVLAVSIPVLIFPLDHNAAEYSASGPRAGTEIVAPQPQVQYPVGCYGE